MMTFAVSIGVACMGELGPGGDGSEERRHAPRDGRGLDEHGNPLPIGASATDLRRLRKVEFRNSVRAFLDQLPDDFDPAADLPRDNHVELAFAVPGTVSELEVKRFADLSQEAIERLGPQAPGSTYVCASDEDTCAREFIVKMATKAFRRPPLEGEVDDLLALYSRLRSDPEVTFEPTEALDIVVEALLQSPGFLYRWELGPQGPTLDGDLVKYGPYEIASRLSYFLWNSSPDEELLFDAESGILSTSRGVETQTRRMMADARFDRALGDFVTQWLEVTELPSIVKDTGVYPRFTPDLARAMYEEARAYTVGVFRSREPTFTHLLTGTSTIASPELASYYGATVGEDGVTDLSRTQRRGILTQGAVLAAKGNSYRTSPVRRGKFILNRLLCASVPPPPPDAVVDLPPAGPNLTLREQLAMHASAPSCNNCHGTMDPLGLAFEHFDGAGAYRETEGNLEVDASGQLKVDGESWTFDNSTDLIELLQGDEDVQDCFATQWVRYALGRFEQEKEAGAVAHVLGAHQDAGLDLSELIVAITTSKPFTHRALRAGEVPVP